MVLTALALGALSGAAFYAAPDDWGAWIGGVEYGDSDAYFDAYEAHRGWVDRVAEWSLGGALAAGTLVVLLLVHGARSRADVREAKVSGRLWLHAAASLAALALGAGMIGQMVVDMALHRVPPWADSPGVPIYGAVMGTPLLLLVANAAAALVGVGARYPAPLWAPARTWPRRSLAAVCWATAGVMSLASLSALFGWGEGFVPGLLLTGYAALLGRASAASAGGRARSRAAGVDEEIVRDSTPSGGP